MKESDESGSSSMVLQLSDSNTSQTKAAGFKKSETGILASIQPESIHPVSTCTVTNPDIITVEIKSESQFWQDDPKDEGNEIPSWHIKEEVHNVSWYWPQQSDQQGRHPWKEEENSFHFGSNLEENHNPQIHLQNEQEVAGYTSAWPGKTYTSTSGYVTPEKRHPRGKSSYMWPECEKCAPFSSDFVGHSETFTELNPSESTLSNSSVLFKHVASTARESCYACKDCEESFACKSTLDRHRMSHTANRPHKCHECGKSFQARSILVVHQRIHTGEKPHQCPDCGKSFRVKSSLTLHQRLHTGEKPFQCPDCGKRFNQRMKLVYHYRTHTGERPYQCFDCGKGFITRSSLVRHERVHS
ncbi:zinc finger protein 572-like [Lacerta agilis]|uniref:zinc finger protein 572-like n=1 Tax=Lacerta agilis TaxID=80427 RepID=UPI001419636F|nr:zinc finger protein 572-like [Lacerta agilis]